ncbi:MAG: hypothetical protein A3B89_02500 [Candidatus Buchananbacteria bacterium RIFCSPHIGHO2_02_FULL_40_13]|nr:MAG: hypothetical protein A3B89_02500 [Candidatus Buchananbacteria bacterium RIFCSPHIGHO2_02_FULL_40_13]
MLILFFLIVFAAIPSAANEKPPLTVGIVVDPLLRERFKTTKEFEAHITGIINRASLIFHANVGRRLVLGVIEVGLSPNTGFSIDDKSAFAWLAEKLERHPSRFWVFLIDRPLASCDIPGIWSGCAMMNEAYSIVAYNSDVSYTVQNLLHELGHNCGADHSEFEDSIMYFIGRNATSYGDKTGVIRDTCGQ